MKRKLAAFIAMVLAFTFVLPHSKALANGWEITRIGSPVQSVTLLGAAFGTDPDGNPVVYTVSSNGNPAVLSVLNARTGELINSFPLPGASGAWGATAVPGGDVYISSYNSAYLFRYTPGSDQVVRLNIPSSEQVLYSTTYDDQGRVYFGSYPNAKIIQFDPATNQFRDYGTIMSGRQYTRSVAYGNGKIYAGIGIPAHLFEIDAETGEKREIELPDKFKNENYVYDLNFAGDKLFARMMDSYTMLVYDVSTGEWVKEIPYTLGLSVSPADADGNVYFRTNTISDSLSLNQNVHVYNLETNELTDTGFNLSAAPRDLSLIELGEQDFPGVSLAAVDTRGNLSYYNPLTGNTKRFSSEPVGIPNRLNSLERGPDGNIYIGGYLSPQEGAMYNPVTNQVTKLPGISQIEGMGAHNGKMYFGTYPGAVIWEHDPTKPWVLRTNPIELFSLKNDGQDRPYAIISAGDRVAIGTTPDYGLLGGALTLYDPVTEEREVFRNLVQDQAIISLAYRDGLIYGGTNIWGGISADPTTTEGKLFIFDMETKQKVWEGVPVAGQQGVTALTFDEEGNLWGLASGTIFKFDTATRTVVSQKPLFPYSGYHNGWMESYQDGNIYGTTLNRVFQFDPASESVTELASNATYFAQDVYGDIYFVRDQTDLYKLEMPTNTLNLQEQIDYYKSIGELEHPLAMQLRNMLRQAEHHWDKGSKWQAIKFMEDFQKRLNDPAMYASEEARAALGKQAERLLNAWLNTAREFGVVTDFIDMEITDQSEETRFFSDSGTVQFEASAEGHHLTYAFEVPTKDNYEIALKAFRAPSYGIYKVLVDGTEVAEVNFHSPSGGIAGVGDFETLATINLTAGTHELKFQNVGKVEQSSNYKLGLVQLQILDKKAQRDRDYWEGK